MTSLNPYLTIGRQTSLVLRAHRKLSRSEAVQECRLMLEAVGIPEPERRLVMYPHELSGGMRQRAMIAMALLCRPALLIADEPTTALDVTVQAQILSLMRDLRARLGAAIILITHDLSVVAGLADRVLVMQKGECREEGAVESVFYEPRDAHTRSLLAAVPRLDRPCEGLQPRPRPPDRPSKALLEAHDIQVRFPVAASGLFGRRKLLRAVDGVSFQLAPGEALGIVGESGCGKSTLLRALLQLVKSMSGRVIWLGSDLTVMDNKTLNGLRRDLQVVFQDPLASLNPRMTVRDIVAEPLETFEPDLTDDARTNKVADILSRVGLDPSHMNRYPHQFSGGQCQRVAIARALITRPKLVVCDEAVSALDVSVRAQILRMLLDLRRLLDVSLIFVSHDLAVIRQVSQRVMVMYLGRVMEIAPVDELFLNPRHPYTRALIAAAPIPDPRIERARQWPGLSGEVSSPLSPPSGCVFRLRCVYAIERCGAAIPPLATWDGAEVACVRIGEI
jgi:oligopeptide/dipeptide ABC transporter ATP-binding protein